MRDVPALRSLVPAWESLAKAAIEPNVFYEPWMLLPALEAFQEPGVEIVTVMSPRGGVGGGPRMIGLFPLVRMERYHRLPIAWVRLVTHPYCFLRAPLIDADHGWECLSAFFDWLKGESGAAFLELRGVPGDGPLAHLLVDVLRERRMASFLSECVTRAMFRPRETTPAYLAAALAGKARRNLQNKHRRLSQLGRVELGELGAEMEVEPWIGEFLHLEASGWKGRGGTAISSSATHRLFFEAIMREAHRQGRLMMHALRLDGRAVAMRASLLAGDGAFAFKIAHDENQARLSPGVLLEAEIIRRSHEVRRVKWMDSCASPSSRLFSELWLDRRTIQVLLVAARKLPGELLISLIPLVRWLRGTMDRRPPPDGDE
ncbi:MAG: GNAT family N-acetyltransferase [Deltaproteobacteria bacterium]|nr:GNAT family N-acetyltransferase [Deltaproteobacteria bacterium]